MSELEPAPRPLSDRLLEAATRIDELPHADLARLLMKAAVRLRTVRQTTRLEHIPVYAYHLLRRISRGPVALATLFGQDDESALRYLLTRQLAEASADGALVCITDAGEELGEVADERANLPPS